MMVVDSNHSLKFTALVVVAFTKKENRHISKQERAASKAHTTS